MSPGSLACTTESLMTFGPDGDQAAWVDRWLSAWTGNRLQAVLDWYADDCAYADELCTRGLAGKSELARHLAPLLRRYPHWRFVRYASTPVAQGIDVRWEMILPRTSGAYRRFGRTRLILRDGLILQHDNRSDPGDVDSRS